MDVVRHATLQRMGAFAMAMDADMAASAQKEVPQAPIATEGNGKEHFTQATGVAQGVGVAAEVAGPPAGWTSSCRLCCRLACVLILQGRRGVLITRGLSAMREWIFQGMRSVRFLQEHAGGVDLAGHVAAETPEKSAVVIGRAGGVRIKKRGLQRSSFTATTLWSPSRRRATPPLPFTLSVAACSGTHYRGVRAQRG